MTLELRVHEDAAQVGMPDEADAEHVPGLALGPERRVPQRRRAGDLRVVAGDARLHAQPMVMRQRVQLVDDLEARLAPQVVDRRQVGEHVEARAPGRRAGSRSASSTVSRGTTITAWPRTRSGGAGAADGKSVATRARTFSGVMCESSGLSVPLERTLAPDVDEPEREHGDEDHHLDEAEHAEAAEQQRPRDTGRPPRRRRR